MKIFNRKTDAEKCKFLTLHCPEDIYIRTDDIAVIRWYPEDRVTKICTPAGRGWVVLETPEQILAMVAEVEK